MLRMAEFLLGDHAESQSQDEWVKYPAKLNEIKLGAHEVRRSLPVSKSLIVADRML